MKQQYSKLVGLLIILLGLLQTNTITAKKEYVKTYEETYSISEGGKVELDNRYGKINIRTWSKNEVNIKVSVLVNTNSESQAESTFDRIKINFSNTPSNVSAKTTIDSKKSFWNFLQRWWGDADLSIDYEVYMPANVDLDVENKYGDLESASVEGNVVLDVKYGNFTIDHAAANLTVKLAYGNGVVAKANNTDVDLAYGKLRINDANIVTIDSKFSKITIESANKIDSDSGYDQYQLGDIGELINEGKYDNFHIDKLEVLNIVTKYTKVVIDELSHQLYSRQNYGGLTVENVTSAVTSIDAEGKYTGIRVNLSELPSFHLEADTRYTSLSTPDDIQFTKQIRENNEHYFEGYRGDSNSAVRIRLSAEYGGLKIR